MADTPTEPEAWLSHEDTACRGGRLARLEWLASVLPPAEYLTYPGGMMSRFLFEEMRYCFAYGQFLATIILGLAYVEHTLAGKFFAGGRDDLERAGIKTLLGEARELGMLTRDETAALDRIRRTRNPATHFRRPLANDSIEFRSMQRNAPSYEVLEQDARAVVSAAMKVLRRDTV